MNLKIKKVNETLPDPKYAHKFDAGLDLFAAEDVVVKQKEFKKVRLGIKTEFDNGYVAILKDRSGVASKRGLTVMAGVIDSTYRGEWTAILYNAADIARVISIGDKIIQAIFIQIPSVHITFTDVLSESKRGENGFGSSD